MKNFCLLATLLVTTNINADCQDGIPASTPTSRFEINGEEVKDKLTGLVWQHCVAGVFGVDCLEGASVFKFTWQEALQWAKTQRSETGKAWRVPNIKELNSIVEDKCSWPAVNEEVFPRTFGTNLWSSTPAPNKGGRVQAMYIGTGGTQAGIRMDGTWSVRLVRDDP